MAFGPLVKGVFNLLNSLPKFLRLNLKIKKGGLVPWVEILHKASTLIFQPQALIIPWLS